MELLEEVLLYIKDMEGETDVSGKESYLHRKVREAIEARAAGEDQMEHIQRRHQIVLRLRVLAVKSHGLTVSLPTLPVARWLDGTVADATKDVYFEEYELSKLLRFIADVGVSFSD